MNDSKQPSKKFQVLVAAAVVICLVGLLGVRLMAKTANESAYAPPQANPGFVPEPKPFDFTELEFPLWSKPDVEKWSVEFKTDLDLIAPLGTGTQNAALWFKDFTKVPEGPRLEEARKMMKQRVESSTRFEKVIPPDHPLLLEAEPWCDQATMSFYTEFIELDGWATTIPNLLVPLNMARAWVARALESDDPEAAMEDCRRAIRLGRLLRQEDVVIITDLVGMACIADGVEGIYKLAQKQGDAELAVLAAVILSEYAPQRFITKMRVADFNVWDFSEKTRDGKLKVDIPDSPFERMIERAEADTKRRFRGEAILFLTLVKERGTPEQQERVIEVLNRIAASEDPIMAESARWALNANHTEKEIIEALGFEKK
jgi:hypothetical protein